MLWSHSTHSLTHSMFPETTVGLAHSLTQPTAHCPLPTTAHHCPPLPTAHRPLSAQSSQSSLTARNREKSASAWTTEPLDHGVKWSGMEWYGVVWSGMEWNGMEWKESVSIHPLTLLVQIVMHGAPTSCNGAPPRHALPSSPSLVGWLCVCVCVGGWGLATLDSLTHSLTWVTSLCVCVCVCASELEE